MTQQEFDALDEYIKALIDWKREKDYYEEDYDSRKGFDTLHQLRRKLELLLTERN